jgi:hypothetical protein
MEAWRSKTDREVSLSIPLIGDAVAADLQHQERDAF